MELEVAERGAVVVAVVELPLARKIALVVFDL